MARIPEAELGRLKREVDRVALVEASGVALRRQGRDWSGLCPWHDDREPSLVVSPERDPPLWHCLGACQAGGTAIDWVMKAERLGFREAVGRLQACVGGAPIAAAAIAEESSAEGPSSEPAVLEPWMDDRQLWDATVGCYRETLAASPSPLAYLERRGFGRRRCSSTSRWATRTAGSAGGCRFAGASRGSGSQAFDRARDHARGDRPGAHERAHHGAGARRERPRGRDVRADDPHEPARGGDAEAPLPRRAAAGRPQLAGAPRAQGSDPLRGAVRRDDLLGGGLRERHDVLGRRRLHRRAPRCLPPARRPPGADRLRPRRGGRRRRRERGRRAPGGRDRVLPGALSSRHGRQRLRVEGRPGREEPRPRDPAGAVDGKGQAAGDVDGAARGAGAAGRGGRRGG